MAKRKEATTPTVESYPVVRDWLVKHNAHCNWQTRIGDNGVESWILGRGVVVIFLYPNKMGWNIATIHPSSDIDTTFRDAEQRCGIVDK